MTTDTSKADSLEQLALRAKNGEPGAMDELLTRIQPDVMRICGRILPHRQDAEEACQDALYKISANLDRFEGRSRFSTWMYTIASNAGRQTYRSLKRRFNESATETMMERPDPRTTSVIAGSRLDLLEALEQLEERRSDAVQAFVLRDLGELTYDEIATELDAPVGTVKSRVHDARVYLRERLTR